MNRLTLGAAITSLGAAAALAAAPANAPAAPARPSDQLVTLPTGDRIAVSKDRAGRVSITMPATSAHVAYRHQRRRGDDFVFPVSSTPYLGRGLDEGLFNVSALIRDGVRDRIPVTVSFPSTGSRTAPTGVVLTGKATAASRGSVTQPGYFATSGAKSFGQALHSSKPGAKPLGTATAIRYAGQHQAPPPRPKEPAKTVSIKVTGPDGRPADGSVALTIGDIGIDGKYYDSPKVENGQATVTVPDGHYALFADQVEADGGEPTAYRAVFGNVTVAGGDAKVELDLRQAKNRMTIDIPRPGTLTAQTLAWFRGADPAGEGMSSQLTLNFPTAIYLSESPVEHGYQRLYLHNRFESKSGGDAYLYDVDSPVIEGPIGSDLRYQVKESELATVDSRYHDPARSTAAQARYNHHSWEFSQSRYATAFTAPLRRTEYVTADPHATYYVRTIKNERSTNPPEQNMTSGFYEYKPGEKTNADWFRQPIAPGFPVDTEMGKWKYDCPACRGDDTLSLWVSPETDSTPDHHGGAEAGSRFQLYRGQEKVADLTNKTGGDFKVPAEKSGYRLVFDHPRNSSHTEWAFSSEHSGKATAPPRWYCGHGDSPLPNCSPVSLLTVNYQLDQGLDNRIKTGDVGFTVNVGHTPGGSKSPISKATIAASYDGGTTWTPLPATAAGPTAFKVKFTVPTSAAGKKVGFKVDAADESGATISQTLREGVTVS